MRYFTCAAALVLLATTAFAHGEGEEDSIRVQAVSPSSPAAAAGLQTGDVIVGFDGQEAVTFQDIKGVMAEHKPGDTVSLVVERAGETVELALTFGEREGGGVSMGVSLAVSAAEGDVGGEPTEGTLGCISHIEETYRIASMIRDLGLDLSEEHEELMACVVRDTQRMKPSDASRYCENIFKVHCSALDLLTEIGEAQVARCEDVIRETLGVEPAENKSWRTCGQHRVFDRYSSGGGGSDEAACKAAFQEECA